MLNNTDAAIEVTIDTGANAGAEPYLTATPAPAPVATPKKPRAAAKGFAPVTGKAATVADAAPEGDDPERYVPPPRVNRPVTSTITVRSDSILGERYLTEVINDALREKGFTNVKAPEPRFGRDPSNYPDHLRAENPHLPLPGASVLDVLVARNPSFMQSIVTVRPGGHHYGTDIPPDSEYPAAGAPVVDYKLQEHDQRQIVAVDAKGGEQFLTSASSNEAAKAIMDSLKRSGTMVAGTSMQHDNW